jgi:UDP-N-acetyl-2-amino-2-deoxyglucuronate dehydrogenase
MSTDSAKNFAITGVAGYIAPRHLQAIKETGNHLVAAMDPHDSVGVIDRYFPQASFFCEFERFDRHLEMLRRKSPSEKIDYLSICSPNHLHDAHIRLALRLGADAICEKPLVINPWNLDSLEELEQETHRKVNSILQLRVHPRLLELREKLASAPSGQKHNVILSYVTARGMWYRYSWKGDVERSGGLATNIGVHFFDLLIWFFGKVQKVTIHLADPERVAGFLELERATVSWFLSIRHADLPREASEKGKSTFRSLQIDGSEVEFTDGFEQLHTVVYKEMLAGRGFGIADVRPSIELVHSIRTEKISPGADVVHPFVGKAHD